MSVSPGCDRSSPQASAYHKNGKPLSSISAYQIGSGLTATIVVGRFSVSAAMMQFDSPRSRPLRLRILVVSLFFASVSVAMADSDWHGKLTIGGDYQGWTDIDNPQGEFDFWHTNVSAHAQRRLGGDSRWAVALQGEYRVFGYRFDGLPIPDPWDDAHVVRLSPRLMFTIDDTWSLFGGPIAEFSGESGVRFSKAIRGGALFGAQWRGSENLTIGLGVLGITEIEDDFLIQPVLIVDWKISDSWRLTTQSWTSRGGTLEIIHSFGDGFEVSVAGGRERERFRLDRSSKAVAPATGASEGVG
ncbi:MAG: hypothetical protein VCB25_06945, partial [Myxococcota bacterium]